MCGKENSPIHGNVNWCNHCGKQYVGSSKKKEKEKEKYIYIELPHSPAITLLDTHLEKVNALSRKDICTPMFTVGFPGDSVLKNLPASAGDMEAQGSIPGRRNDNPLQYSHGQRSLEGYCPWGIKRVRHYIMIQQ